MPTGSGYVSVEVSMNDQNYSDDNVMFEYQVGAHVEHIIPNKGAVEGGSLVMVTGSNFSERSAALSYLLCRFNLTTVSAVYVGSHTLHCVTPEHPTGVVSVEVSMNKQQFTNDGVQYEYQEVALLSVSPVGGPVKGGTVVMLSGSQLYGSENTGLYCMFGVDGVVSDAWS